MFYNIILAFNTYILNIAKQGIKQKLTFIICTKKVIK